MCADDNVKSRAKSIGEVASPLLAGFSFTNVIVIIVSDGTGHFLLPGEAIISWTIASIALVASVQFAKYAAEGVEKRDYGALTDIFYHIGVLAFLLGFSLALAPQSGATAYWFRWIATVITFAVSAFELNVYRKRPSWWYLVNLCRTQGRGKDVG